MSTLLIIIWIVSGFILLHNIQVQDSVNSRLLIHHLWPGPMLRMRDWLLLLSDMC